MIFLEFEKPLESLYEQLDKIVQVGQEGDIDVSDKIRELENKIKNKNIGKAFEYYFAQRAKFSIFYKTSYLVHRRSTRS